MAGCQLFVWTIGTSPECGPTPAPTNLYAPLRPVITTRLHRTVPFGYRRFQNGAAALTMGWFWPDLFRRLTTYSGTFVDQQDELAPEEVEFPFGAWEYHSNKEWIKSEPLKPVRIFMHVSEHDFGVNELESSHHNWVMANQRTAADLKERGYH